MNSIQNVVESKKERGNLEASRFVKSSLFNEVFVLRDIQKELKHFFDDEEMSGFYEFWIRICSFAEEFNSKKEKLENSDIAGTTKELIIPVLELLGYGERNSKGLDNFLEYSNLSLPTQAGVEESIKVPLLVMDSASKRESFEKAINSPDRLIKLRNCTTVPVVTDYFDAWADLRIDKYNSNKGLNVSNKDNFSYLDSTARCVE